MPASDLPPEGTSQVPLQQSGEVLPKGKSWLDVPMVFGVLAVAYALAIAAVTVSLWGWYYKSGPNSQAVDVLYTCSPLVILGIGITFAALCVAGHFWTTQSRLTLGQRLLQIAGIVLPLLAVLAYGIGWVHNLASYKFGL
jgi:cytochrome bd-type quinol oxidase subunit 1